MKNCITKLTSSAAMFITAIMLSGCFGSGNGTTADTTAPTTTAAPSVSGTTDTATTLSVTVNEDGTGYYYVRFTGDPTPTVAEVQAGGSFAMTANVAATPAISGLIFNTPYTIYFVAKDAAGNVQGAVQSVAVTTAPTTTTGYVTQGGLTWMPVTFSDTWANADNYCTNTNINGVIGWRLPTQEELATLYAAYPNNSNSTVLADQAWILSFTWSSTQYSAGIYNGIDLYWGGALMDFVRNPHFVTCVR